MEIVCTDEASRREFYFAPSILKKGFLIHGKDVHHRKDLGKLWNITLENSFENKIIKHKTESKLLCLILIALAFRLLLDRPFREIAGSDRLFWYCGINAESIRGAVETGS